MQSILWKPRCKAFQGQRLWSPGKLQRQNTDPYFDISNQIKRPVMTSTLSSFLKVTPSRWFKHSWLKWMTNHPILFCSQNLSSYQYLKHRLPRSFIDNTFQLWKRQNRPHFKGFPRFDRGDNSWSWIWVPCGLALPPLLLQLDLCRKIYAEKSQAVDLSLTTLLAPSSSTDTDLDEVSPDSLVGQIWMYVQEDWTLLLAVIISGIAGALVNIFLPRLMGKLVTVISHPLSGPQQISISSSRWRALAAALAPLNASAKKLLCLFGIKSFLMFSHIALLGMLGERVARRLRHAIFGSILRQEMAFFDSIHSAELTTRVGADVHEFRHTFKQCVSTGIRATAEITGSFLQLLVLSPTLTAVLASTMPLLYAVGAVYGACLRQISRESKILEAQSLGLLGEVLSNIRTVRSYAAEFREMDQEEKRSQKILDANTRLAAHIGAFQGITSGSIGCMILAVLYYGGALVAQGRMEPGDLMAYLLATQTAQRSLASLSVLVSQVIKAQAAASRVFEFIGRVPSIPLRGGLKLSELHGNIEFQNVNFIYPSRPDITILEKLSLTVPAGKIVALCGASGAGKSSLVMLLERFYDVRSGQVLVDGHDIRTLDMEWLRNQIGYIAQQPTLFSTTIRENIRYGCPSASEEDIIEAAKLANAHEFIVQFPDGYDTVVGERGASLSGGQRQRVAIAAAILKNPRVLILDESTSALDNESERLVQNALDKLMKGRTVRDFPTKLVHCSMDVPQVLVIAHRLSTIQNADLIVVLGKPRGRILEMGCHDELMRQKGAYYQLHESGGSDLLDT